MSNSAGAAAGRRIAENVIKRTPHADIAPVAGDIRRECAPFLALRGSAKRLLYRGAGKRGTVAFMDRVRRDRVSRNMPAQLHAAGDAWFSRRLGVRYRGAGLFCTGSHQQAAEFGNVVTIFPRGAFQFCWSPKVSDLHVWSKANGLLDVTPEEFVGALEGLEYQDEDLPAAIDSGNEIMVACATYYPISVIRQQ